MAKEMEASWLADGVKEIERISRTAMITEPKLISVPQEKPGTYGIVVPGPAGNVKEIVFKVAGPLWHNERLNDPAQLKTFIASMSERGVKPETGAVYISEEAITYVYDFEDRRHRAVCPLKKTKPWIWLEASQQAMDQRTIVRLLRILFDGALAADSNLLSVLRNVKWKQDGNVEANLQRGKGSARTTDPQRGRGISNFPEEFVFTLNVFENYEHPVAVRVALEILPDIMKFEVIPFPSQVQKGLADTLLWLQSDIASTKVPTFIGAVTAGKHDSD